MRKGLIYADDDPRVVALKQAIQIGGGLTAVATALGIKAQAVYKWEVCPPARCRALASLTGIPPETLRPDVFGEQPGKPGTKIERAA